jgi:hypothetical protein
MKYSNNKSTLLSIVIGGFIGLFGIAMLFISIIFGVIVLIVAGVLYYFLRHLTSNTEVIFDANGFSVTVSSKRKGAVTNQYLWREVTGTSYYIVNNGEDGSTSHFRVMTANGPAFDVYRAKGFHEMIELVNQNTMHLPYFWEKTKSFTKPYQQVMRQ